MDSSSRRTVLKAGGLTATALLAGCLRLDTQEGGAVADGQTGTGGEGGTGEETASNSTDGDSTENTDGTINGTENTDGTINGTENTDGTREISLAYWEAFNQSDERVQTADDHIQRSVTAAEDQLWELCTEEVSAAQANVERANEHANEARAIADDEGSDGHQDAIAMWIDLVALQEEQVAEAEAMCQAGIDGNSDAVQRHRGAIADMDAEIEDIRAEVEATFEEMT